MPWAFRSGGATPASEPPSGAAAPDGAVAAEIADTGAADPALWAALTLWSAEPSPESEAQVHAALADARLFVPVTTAVRSSGDDAHDVHGAGAPEAGHEVTVVTIVAASGASALVAFSSVDAVTDWRADVRPVAVSARQVCEVAVEEAHEAVVLDPGRAAFSIEGAALLSVAEGYVPVAGGGQLASRRVDSALRFSVPAQAPPPEFVSQLRAALSAEPIVRAAYLVDAAVEAEPPILVVGLVLVADVEPSGLAALVQRLADTLGPVLPSREGLDLTVLSGAQVDAAAILVGPVYDSVG